MRIAAIQMTSGADRDTNLDTATHLIRKAAKAGAEFVGVPENFAWMGPETERDANAETLEGATLSRMAGLARELEISVLAGSVLEQGAPGNRLYNTSVLFGPEGQRLGVYRKIHLGMSVCYDLRFPELYRKHAEAGAVLLTVPAAFTLMTGKDHWEVLLRARAIENQAYVMAPAQQGQHPKDRMTWGHAMVIDPWGLVIARASEGVGFAMAELDAAYLAKVRKSLPALQHRRL
jgi:deaminated glutathione amidase